MKGKIIILAAALLVIGGSIAYLELQKPRRSGSQKPVQKNTETGRNAAYPQYIELERISGYINTDSITIGEFIGKKVLLVDFWTYSCINCQRTQPYLNAWYQKYRDQGLEIIGVHTPEFEFEKKYDNVAAAVRNAGIQYPVVQDNAYATWSAYGNRYWPRKYLIDIHGNIVYDHIGEGSYAETETKIQELLAERVEVLGETETIATDIAKPADVIKVDTTKPISPETYFGYLRNEFLANGESAKAGEQDFPLPSGVVKNQLYLNGRWNITKEYAENVEADARIIYRYEGKAVYLVARSEQPVILSIGRDGAIINEGRGTDVDANGLVTVQSDRLYTIVEDSAYGEHTLEIIINAPGVQVFAFTFG